MEVKKPGNGVDSSVATIDGTVLGTPRAMKANRGNRASEIDQQFVEAGTYYVVVSSTDDNFPVEMMTEEVPVPEPVLVYSPYDTQTGVEAPYLVEYLLGNYTTEMQVLFGSVYPPTTPLIDWTSDLVESFFLTELEHNKTYFLQINERNAAGTTEGDIIGFTTVIDDVDGFTADRTEIFNDETVTFTWTANRSLQGYNIYRDGVKVNETPITGTSFTDGPLDYNMLGYEYQIAAAYDEGESTMSDPITVYVSGYGEVSGHAWEIDSITPIYNASIVLQGLNEFGEEETITLEENTNPSGAFSGQVHAGTYTAIGLKDGYMDNPTPEFDVVYDLSTDDINVIMLEATNPLGMITATEEENDVLVEWSWNPASLIVDFETGDFSQAEFTLPATYPWAITNSQAHEGTYAMKSTCEGVASGSSIIEATVDVPYDGKMSFYVKVSSETNYDKFFFYIDGVQQGAALSGAADWALKEFDVTEGTHTYKWEYTKDSSVNSNDDCVYVDDITMYRYEEPLPPLVGATAYNFDDGLQGWTSLDANNDGYGWVLGSEIGGVYLISGASLAGSGHNSSNDMVCSGSYSNATNQAITPDNYLVSPTQISASNGAQINFWACAQDASYAAEHFGVAVSTTTATASAFTTIQEWTMTAKGVQGRTAESEFDVRGTRDQGAWYQYTVDLSSYAGQDIWVAIRHFNCNDQFILNVDDITLADGSAKAIEDNRQLMGYNLYRRNLYGDGDTTLIATPGVDVMSYIDNEWPNLPFGVYSWGIQAKYEGNHHYAEKGRDIIEIGDGTSTTYVTPFNSLWGYSFVEQIYTAEEIGSAGTINSISFNLQSTDSETNSVDVFMKNVSRSTFTSATDFETVEAADMVFSGSVTFNNGWTTITLDTPFYYDGTSNLMIGMHEYTSGYSTRYFYYTSAADKVVSFHSDSADPNPYDLGSYSGNKYVSPNRANIQIDLTAGGGGGAAGGGLSDILWSNEIEKDMEAEVTFNIALNNDQDPAGATIEMVGPEETYNGTFEEATLVFDAVRKGTYTVSVELAGYESVSTELEITADATYDIFLEEVLEVVDNLYVSPTGWAVWESSNATSGTTAGSGSSIGGSTGGGGGGGGTGSGDTFSFDFASDFAGWTSIDADGDGNNWAHSSNSVSVSGYDYTGLGHGSTNGFVYSQSYTDLTYTSFDPDNYLISPAQYNIVAGSTLTFWADYANDSYPDHFGVAVATTASPTASDFTMVWEGSAKNGNGNKAAVRHNDSRYENWREHSIDLSAYAGQSVWIAFRHYNSYDMYEVWIDDVELTAGSKGDRYAVRYKVELDGVYEGETPNMFWQHDVTGFEEGETHVTRVAPVYATGMGDWVEYTWTYQDCSNFVGATNVTATENEPGTAVEISWTMPEGGVTPPPVGPGDTFSVDFEDSQMPTGWTTIDANNDGYDWVLGTQIGGVYLVSGSSLAGAGHNSSNDLICSGSYSNVTGVINPDNYLVSPQVTLVSGSTFSFWACAQDASYAAEHFGVFVSDNGTSDWTEVQSWTMTAKGSGVMSIGRNGQTRAQGNWYNYSVDLSAYAGQKYIAIRHFNCSDQFILDVDDIELSAPGKGGNTFAAAGHGFGIANNALTDDGNWYYYDNGVNEDAIGTGGGNFWWAIMLPAGSYEGNSLTKVAAYDYMAMTGTASIYQGGNTAPAGSALGTVNVTFTGSEDFVEFTFAEPVTIDPSQNVWVVFYNGSGAAHPAAVCANTGDANGRWVSLDGTAWEDLASYSLNYTFMIRAYIENGGVTPPPTPGTVAITPNAFNIFMDGELIGATTDTTFTYTCNDAEEHQYCVMFIDANYNVSCAQCINVVADPDGIGQYNVVSAIYPNPTNGNLYINTNANMKSISIVNVLGQVVYNKATEGTETIVDMAQFGNGIYMVNIVTENGTSVNRIIVNK
jgi:hypothetical protein